MATETVASDQILATDEQVEKKMSEDEKASEQESVSLSKGSEEKLTKTKDPENLTTLSTSEGVDYKKTEPPVVEAEKASDAPAQDFLLGEEKVENEPIVDSQTPNIPKQVADAVESPAELPRLIESVVREAPKEPAVDIIEVEQVEQPKIVDAPLSSVEATEKLEEPLEVTSDKGSVASGVPLVDEPKVENEPLPDSQTPNIPKQGADAVESQAEVHTNIESVVREAPIEIGQLETVDAPQSSFEAKAIEKREEPSEVTSDQGSVATVLEENKDSEPESLEVQKRELSIAEVEEKPEDQSEVTQQLEKKHDEVEPEEHVQDETEKDEGSVADKIDETTFLEKEKTETDDTPSLAVEEEPEPPKLPEQEKKHEKNVEDERVKDEGSSVDKVEESTFLEEGTTDKDDKPILIGRPEEASLSREAPIELRDEGDSSLPGVTEKIAAEDQKQDLSGVDAVEKLAKEAPVETEKFRKENLETEENEKRNVIPEDSTQPIEEDQKKESSGVDVVEKLVEKAAAEPEKVGEKEVETEDSIQPIIEDQKKELGGADVIEKLAEEAPVKLEKVGEENVAKNAETEDNEKKNLITEDSTQPIEDEQERESGGVDVVEKLGEEAAVKLEKVGEEKVAKNDGIEKNEERNLITEDSTQPIEEDQKKEFSGVDVLEKLAEETPVEIEKSGEENETKNVKFEDNENRNVINEVSTQPLEDDVKSSISPTEVIEKSFEEAGKDVEPGAENERVEHIKDETPAKVETKKDESVEEKQDEKSRAVNEPLIDSNQSESEVKGEETAKTDADKLEKFVDNAAKSDQNVEPPPTKDGDQTKPSQDLPKEVPSKPSQKQSNTILSKVKQSLVKAKKAITGKSPSSKTPASGTKDDIKVK